MLSSTARTLRPPARVAASHRSGQPGFGQRAVSTLRRAGLALWHGLEQIGQARARRELRRLADAWVVADPEGARRLRAASHFDATSRGRAPACRPLAERSTPGARP